jgi:fatty acid desaturase
VALWLTSAPLGTDFVLERRVHLDHHARLGEDDDPDRDLYRAEDKADRPRLVAYLSGATTLPGMRNRPGSGSNGVAALVVNRRHAIPAQIVMFGVFATALEWWLYLPLWIAPLFVLMLIPQRVRQFCEHAQPQLPDLTADEHRLVSYRPGIVERVFLAPFHMGYHAEHHLWPSVPWFALPELAALVPVGAIEYRGAYAGFLRRYFAQLPLAKEIGAT